MRQTKNKNARKTKQHTQQICIRIIYLFSSDIFSYFSALFALQIASEGTRVAPAAWMGEWNAKWFVNAKCSTQIE